MNKRAKAAVPAPLPPAFVDLNQIKECLRTIEAGCEYLDSLVVDDDLGDGSNPLPDAVWNYRNSALQRFAEIRKFLNSGAAVINPKHPRFAEMYSAVQRIANEYDRCRYEGLTPTTGTAPKPSPRKSPLLLVPACPEEAPPS